MAFSVISHITINHVKYTVAGIQKVNIPGQENGPRLTNTFRLASGKPHAAQMLKYATHRGYTGTERLSLKMTTAITAICRTASMNVPRNGIHAASLSP